MMCLAFVRNLHLFLRSSCGEKKMEYDFKNRMEIKINARKLVFQNLHHSHIKNINNSPSFYLLVKIFKCTSTLPLHAGVLNVPQHSPYTLG